MVAVLVVSVLEDEPRLDWPRHVDRLAEGEGPVAGRSRVGRVHPQGLPRAEPHVVLDGGAQVRRELDRPGDVVAAAGDVAATARAGRRRQGQPLRAQGEDAPGAGGYPPSVAAERQPALAPEHTGFDQPPAQEVGPPDEAG